MAILIFVIVLFVLVLVHEFGHYITAKWSGMRVDEFGIGFPPRMFSWRRGETEYSLNALPIGGFVRIYGENGEDAATPDTPRAFAHRPRILQAIVLLAGVAMNILLAFLLYSATNLIGVQTIISEDERTDASRLVITSVLKESPAAIAGILSGDHIVNVQNNSGSAASLSPTSVSSFIQNEGENELFITYERGDEIKMATLTPRTLVVEGEETRPRVGFVMGLVETKRYSFVEALKVGALQTWTGLQRITIGIGALLYDAVRGEADFTDVAGPIGIAGLAGDASRFGFTSILIFTAFISLNLAVINLLPLPALDGGRLVIVFLEAVIRKPINPTIVSRVNLIGFLLLILLMVVVTAHDIVKLF